MDCLENYSVCSAEEASHFLRGCQNTSKFWRGFSDSDVETLVKRMDFVKVKTGETIINEDDPGSFVAVLLNGSASVYAKKNIKVGTVSKGDIIGENALFEGDRRTASVVSSSNSTVLALWKTNDIVDAYLNFPDIGLKVVRILACSGMSKLTQRCLLNSPKEELSHVRTCSVSRMSRYLNDAHQVNKGLGEGISDKELDFLAKRVTLLIYEEGAHIINEGMIANYVFFILEGSVVAKVGGAKGEKIGALSKGQFVGETAFVDGFLTEKPRNNDVFAGTETVMLAAMSYTALPELNSAYPLLAFKMFHRMAQTILTRLRSQVNAVEKRETGKTSSTKAEKPYLSYLLEELKKKEDLSWSLGTGDARLHHSKKKMEDIFTRRTMKNGKKAKAYKRLDAREPNKKGKVDSDSEEEDLNDSDCTFEQACKLLTDVQAYSQHFNGLSVNDIEWIAKKISLLKVPDGELIAKEGEESSFSAVLLDGEADFIIQKTIKVGKAHKGEILGEMGLFEGGKRSADVRSCSDETVIAIFKYEDLIATNISFPELGLKLLQLFTRAAKQKLLDRITRSADEEIKVSSTHDHVQLYYELKSVQDDSKHRSEKNFGLHHDLQDHELQILAKHMRYLRFQMNSRIFEKGSIASCLMFILHGEIEARVGGLTGVLLGKKARGEYIGENSFLENGSEELGTRMADVFSKNFTSCAFISFREVEEFNRSHPMIVLKMLAQMAEGVLARQRSDIRKLEKDTNRSPKSKARTDSPIGAILRGYDGSQYGSGERETEEEFFSTPVKAKALSKESSTSQIQDRLLNSKINANQIEEMNNIVQQMRNEIAGKDEEILLLKLELEECRKKIPEGLDAETEGFEEGEEGANGHLDVDVNEYDYPTMGKKMQKRLETLLQAADDRIQHLESCFAPLIRSHQPKGTRFHIQQEIKRLAAAKNKKKPKAKPEPEAMKRGAKPLLVECSDIRILNTGQIRPSSAPTRAGGFSKKDYSPKKTKLLTLAESPKTSMMPQSPFVERYMYSPYHSRWEKVKRRPNTASSSRSYSTPYNNN
ncbi:hypothetical protein HOP50_01g05770 [Chloropicon primus]|uniref:Cyclic nucleotide-binding domain-containing protein n=1 Tax=Chloropicon primus TaxID=1764295 RepID=A0A5B8MCF0_9CHLO|nr:hypothetical protein A3770_01p05910 [Chloropicon primus]UPQ97286.1 hypothetical protein HOP50_01g05770 [Chloropicon primus]|eukprot:QDZ18073.1 hypothetical protein A3770_01p05910 [Chloropicon primus]